MFEETTIMDLPIEIITEIFMYVSFIDLKELSLVCHQWYDLIQQPRIARRFHVNIPLDNEVTRKNFGTVEFHARNITPNFPFKNHIQQFSFRCCRTSSSNLLLILKRATHLKKLELEGCDFYTINKFEILDDSVFLKNIETLVLSGRSKNLNDIFEILMSVMPNIKNMEIQIERMVVTDMCGGDLEQMGVDETLILKYIKLRATKLEHLKIDHLSKTFLNELTEIPDLKLLSLWIPIDHSCKTEVQRVLSKHESLTSLVIENIEVPNEIFLTISNYLKNLKILKFNNWFDFDMEVLNIGKLNNLEHLYLRTSYRKVYDVEIPNDFFKLRNESLKKITLEYIPGLKICEISEKFLNLRELKFKSNSNISNDDLQVIWKHLRWIIRINIEMNPNDDNDVTNYSLTGVPETNEQKKGYSIKELKGIRELKLNFKNEWTKDCLKDIAELKELTILKLIPIKIYIEDLFLLKECKRIQRIRIRSDTDLSPSKDIYKQLKECFPRLKRFEFQTNDDYIREG